MPTRRDSPARSGPPFVTLIDTHQRAVYRYLVRCTGNEDDAQDLFQETFLRAHRAYAAFSGDTGHRAWLFRIATNLAKNHVRGRRRRNNVFVSGCEPAPPARQPVTPEHLLHSRQTARVLQGLLDRLSFRQRTAVIQRQIEGLAYCEIAGNLNCSEQTARAHVYQGLRKLRAGWQTAQANEERKCHAPPKA